MASSLSTRLLRVSYALKWTDNEIYRHCISAGGAAMASGDLNDAIGNCFQC